MFQVSFKPLTAHFVKYCTVFGANAPWTVQYLTESTGLFFLVRLITNTQNTGSLGIQNSIRINGSPIFFIDFFGLTLMTDSLLIPFVTFNNPFDFQQTVF